MKPHFIIYCIHFLLSSHVTSPYRFFGSPEISVVRWISTAEVMGLEGEFADWRTDFAEITEEEIKYLDGRSTIVVSQHIYGLEVICNASYPVEWEFKQAELGNEEVDHIMMKTSRDISNPRNDRFIASLQIVGDLSISTGNYTCRSLNNAGMEESVFIFWDGSSPPYLVLSGRTVHVYLEENNTTLIVPCHVTQPNIVVQLFREINGSFQPVQQGPLLQFDPKIGFLIDLKKYGLKTLYGRFKCTTTTEDDEVNIIVEKGQRPKREFSEVRSPGTDIYYDPERKEVACCGKKGSPPPTLHNILCETPSMCRMKKHKLYKSGNNGKKIINGSCISDRVYMREYGMLRCKGDGIDIFRTFYTDFGPVYNEPQGLHFSFKEMVPQRMMHVTVIQRGPYYHMERISVVCEGMNSYFSDGHKWSIKWKNDTVTNFEPTYYEDDPRMHGFRVTDVHLHWTMAELICSLPVWNSTEWISQSVKLDVQKSTVPIIGGPTIEEVKMVLNETEKLVECKSFAKPAPSIKWKKNGDNVPTNMIILNSNGTSVLLFHRVTHDTQGEYKCVAENVMGATSKIIRIIVEGKEPTGSSTWSTTAAVLVPLLIIAFLVVVGLFVWKMQIQKKVVNHLSRIVFRDTERQAEYTA